MEVLVLILIAFLIFGAWYICKEWKNYKNPPEERMKSMMAEHGVVDMINMYTENKKEFSILRFKDRMSIVYEDKEYLFESKNDIKLQIVGKSYSEDKFSVGKAVVGTIVFGAVGGAIIGNKGKQITYDYEVIEIAFKDNYGLERTVDVSMNYYEQIMKFLAE